MCQMLAFRNLTILNRRDPRAGRLDKITEFLRQSVYCLGQKQQTALWKLLGEDGTQETVWPGENGWK